jgi:two-component system response regulator AtoC
MLEKELIERALNKTGGNRTKAAKMLEVSRPMLISKIKVYGLS